MENNKSSGVRKVTLSDVARWVDMDLSTVSRVLNRSFENHKYAPKTVRRIQSVAMGLGYQPSMAARSLRTGKTMLLGLIVPDISNSFFGELASALDNCIGEDGYRLMISNTNENPERQAGHVDGLISHGVDGLIVSPSGDAGLDKAVQSGVPLVTVDRPVNTGGFPFVGLDNEAAAGMLVAELKKRGYSRVGVVLPESGMDRTLQQRTEGLQRGLVAEGCSVQWVVQAGRAGGVQNEARRLVAEKLNNCASRPNALVGLTNTCTMGIIEALEDLELAWGKDLGVAGIDDFQAASLVRPAVTVAAQPIQQIAAEAFSLLLKQMERKTREVLTDQVVVLDPVWVERESLTVQQKVGIRGL